MALTTGIPAASDIHREQRFGRAETDGTDAARDNRRLEKRINRLEDRQ